MMRLALVLLVLAGVAPALAFDPFEVGRIDWRPGAAVPLDTPFRDQTGARVTLREIAQGMPLLLAPVLHRCPNICGVTLSGLVEAVEGQRFVPGRDFAMVALGIDPEEGPADAAAAVDALEQRRPGMAAGALHALTGKSQAVAAVTEALGYRYAWDERIGQYAHVAAVAVLTPDGRLARWIRGLAPDPGDVRLALTEAGQGRLGDWSDRLLLLCYHYDPETGRYSALVRMILRIAAGILLIAGAGFLAVALWRDRRLAGRGGP